MKTPSPRQQRRAAAGNVRAVPRKFRSREAVIQPRPGDALNLKDALHKSVKRRLDVGLGKAERIERKHGGRP